MNTLCHGYRCKKLGTKFCGACGLSCYCSGECQKVDWKVHKHWCADKLPTKFIALTEVTKLVAKAHEHCAKLVQDEKSAFAAIIMEKIVVFLECQLGSPVPSQRFLRKREDGSLLDDMPLYSARQELTSFYATDENFAESLAHAIECRKMLEIRRPLGEEKYLYHLFHTESTLHKLYARLHQLPESQFHGEQCVAFARRLRGESRTKYLYDALRELSGVRQSQSAFSEALELAQEAYTTVSEVYGPEHPDVQQASGRVIDCLMSTGEYSLADDFARISYESLVDPRNGFDPDGIPHRIGMMQLAEVWTKMPADPNEDPERGEESERMARKVCELVMAEPKRDFPSYLSSIMKLMDVIGKKGNCHEQTFKVLRDISELCMKMSNSAATDVMLRSAVDGIESYVIKP